jgi:hypothetical protein
MNRISIAIGGAALSALLWAPGCGGGGGGGTTADGGSASVLGGVETVDGETANLGGIAVTDTRTGETAVTDEQGAFDLGDVPIGTLELCVGRDGEATEVAELADGETATVHLHVRDGRIEGAGAILPRLDHVVAEFRLERAATSDDEDVEGRGRIEASKLGSAIGVAAKALDAGREVEWFVISPGGDEESQGVKAVGDLGFVEWLATTREGSRLPFGVDSVKALEGYRVEIRDASAGTVLLVGRVPPLPVPPDPNPDCVDASGRALLRRADGVLGEAYVGVLLRTCVEPVQAFGVEVTGQASGAVFTVWLADPNAPDTLNKVGRLEIDERGFGLFLLSSRKGDAMPYDARVPALVGLAVEVRDEEGALAYAGHVPELVRH